jgi:hypothetical protein
MKNIFKVSIYALVCETSFWMPFYGCDVFYGYDVFFCYLLGLLVLVALWWCYLPVEGGLWWSGAEGVKDYILYICP